MNVLMLHDIREFQQNFFPNRYKLPYFLSVQQFHNIISNLNDQKKNILSFDESLDFDDDAFLKEKVILTFDDGLKDHLAVARKLKEQKIKGCFFVPSGPILEQSIIDSHKIQFILASAYPKSIVDYINYAYENNFNRSSSEISTYFLSRWENNIWDESMVFVTRVLREYPDIQWKRNLINELFEKYVSKDSESFSSEFYLNEKDVNEILQMGHIVGGHGHYSYDLRFEDDFTVIDEINKMNEYLTKLGQNIKVYAYANGGYNNKVISLLEQYKFDFAFTTRHKSVHKEDHKFEIPRIDATKTDLININSNVIN
jgi:peptidoglycan/xylan/chitin deacetylase (PgdA/CDA1 family)